ncbi:hypothetical protein ACHAXR_008346 [Thalassiosira sp. AJA248-18]
MKGKTIEMLPMGAAYSDDDDVNANDIFEPDNSNQRIIEATSSTSLSRATASNQRNNNTSRRVKKNYLSMIGLAYILTILSPRTILWSYSTSCNYQSRVSNTTIIATPIPRANNSSRDISETDNDDNHNATNSTTSSHPSNQNTIQTIGKCMYGSINMTILAKLTCSTLALIILFFNLQGSSPGVLTNDVMAQLDVLESNENVTTTINDERGRDDDEEADAERQSFLEPLPLLSTKDNPQPLSTIINNHHHQQQQRPTQKLCYPHTRRKYCNKCQIHPPLRSHHCNICNRCIATFDHHCLFLDTCIGERNHFRFWLFLVLNVVCLQIALDIVGSSSSSGGHVGVVPRSMGTSLLLGHNEYTGESQLPMLSIRIGQVIIILSKMYMYSIYTIATLLWIIHTTLALVNNTTFEMTKGSEHIDYLTGTGMMDFPFGRGLLNNIRMFFSRDDVASSSACNGERNVLGRILHCYRRFFGTSCCCNVATTKKSIKSQANYWVPIIWEMPECIDRESEDWWNHPWQNKYWSCC